MVIVASPVDGRQVSWVGCHGSVFSITPPGEHIGTSVIL